MSVAQLKALIEEHGHSHVDCPELSGLRDRAREAIASSHQTSAGSDDRDDDESASHRESAAEEDEGPSEPPPQAPDEPTPEASELEPVAATEDEVLDDAASPGETTNPLVAASSAAVAKKQPATSRLSVYLSTTDKAEEPAAARQAEVDNAADVLGIRLAEKKKPSAKEKAHAEGLAKAKQEADEAKRKLAEVEAERARERYELAEAKRADAEATANAAQQTLKAYAPMANGMREREVKAYDTREVTVTVPSGAQPGQTFAVQIVVIASGQNLSEIVRVTCPQNTWPGTKLQLQLEVGADGARVWSPIVTEMAQTNPYVDNFLTICCGGYTRCCCCFI